MKTLSVPLIANSSLLELNEEDHSELSGPPRVKRFERLNSLCALGRSPMKRLPGDFGSCVTATMVGSVSESSETMCRDTRSLVKAIVGLSSRRRMIS